MKRLALSVLVAVATLSSTTVCLSSFAAVNSVPVQARDFSDYKASGYYKLQKASKLADQGDLEEANELYLKTTERLPQSLMNYFSLGETSYKLSQAADNPIEQRKHLQNAKWAYYRVANLHPDLTLGYYKLAEITWDLEAYDEARSILEEGLEMHPGDLLMTYSLGLTYEKLEAYENAKETYQRVIGLNPKYAPAYNSLAGIFEEERNFKRAEENYKAAIKLDPSNTEFQITYAAFLANDGRIDEAESLAQLALREDPDNYLIYVTLGHIQYDRHQYDKALIYYTKAAGLNPDYSATYYYMSLTLEQLNRKDEAITQGLHYVNVSPNGRYAKQANELILTLKEKSTSKQ